jgi:hypothetical protein
LDTANNSTTTITSTQRIYEAVRELRNLEQTATRESVAALTSLRLSIVDDRLRALVDDGKLKRLLRGIYEMVEQFAPPRPMSCSILSDGQVNFEIGDAAILFSPQEARSAARALAGFAEDARVIESTRQHLFLATELAAKVKKLEIELKAVKASVDVKQQSLAL